MLNNDRIDFTKIFSLQELAKQTNEKLQSCWEDSMMKGTMNEKNGKMDGEQNG